MRIDRLVFCSFFALALLLASGVSAEEAKQEAEKPAAKADDEADSKEIPTVITDDWLHKRYGREVSADSKPAEAQGQPAGQAPAAAAAPAAADPKTGGKPASAGSEQPEMTPEQRTARIAEIEAELLRLDKRILGLKNPLLRGTYPATGEERQAEAGKTTPEQIAMVEQRKSELKDELAELRAQ